MEDKKDINYIYNNILQKIETNSMELTKDILKPYPSIKKQCNYRGKIEAYTDIKILIEESGLLKK